MTPDLIQALQTAKYMYLTTYSRAGKPGTVPVWLWYHDGAVYFTTQRESLKARRIRNNGRVTVHAGKPDGPSFDGRAEWVDDGDRLSSANYLQRDGLYPIPREGGADYAGARRGAVASGAGRGLRCDV